MIFTGWMYGTDTLVNLEVKNGIFTSVAKTEPASSVTYPNIAPVLFDTQINGFNGIDFNTKHYELCLKRGAPLFVQPL